MKAMSERLADKYVESGDCWIWTGAKNKNGYGCVSTGKGTSTTAHKASYQVHVGPVAEGLDVCHKCDNPSCINPKHLFLGTRKENMQDSKRKGRQNPARAKGEETGSSKLTNDQVISVFKSAKAGVSLSQIAKTYNVRKQTIWSIAHGKSWTHITGALQP